MISLSFPPGGLSTLEHKTGTPFMAQRRACHKMECGDRTPWLRRRLGSELPCAVLIDNPEAKTTPSRVALHPFLTVCQAHPWTTVLLFGQPVLRHLLSQIVKLGKCLPFSNTVKQIYLA